MLMQFVLLIAPIQRPDRSRLRSLENFTLRFVIASSRAKLLYGHTFSKVTFVTSLYFSVIKFISLFRSIRREQLIHR